MQEVLDTALERAPDRAKAQFALLVSDAHQAGQPDNTKQFTAASDIPKGEITLWRPAGVDIDTFNPDDEERIILAARRPRRSDPGVVDALSRVLSGQRRAEDSIGSALLIEPVKAQLAVVSDLVT